MLQAAIITVDVFLVQGPANTLGRTALELTLDVVRMHCLTGILHHRVANDFRCPGFRVDLDVAYVTSERHASTIGHCLAMAGNRPT